MGNIVFLSTIVMVKQLVVKTLEEKTVQQDDVIKRPPVNKSNEENVMETGCSFW